MKAGRVKPQRVHPFLAGLKVEPGESKATILMFLHSFFKGTALVFFETAASAMFLTTFTAELLPHVYVAAAMISALTGLAFSRLRTKFSFGPLMIGILALMVILTAGSQAGLWLSEKAWLTFAILVIYRLMWFLTDLQYWAVATRLFDVRQAKRLFGLVGSGEVIARILGSLSIPLAVKLFGVRNLISFAAVGITLCLVFLVIILRSFPEQMNVDEQPDQVPRTAKKKAKAKSSIFASRYVTLIACLSVCGVLGKYLVDFAFLQNLQLQYQDAARLAIFMAVFTGIAQLVNLGIRLVITGRLLSRYGILMGLLVLPVAHMLVTTAMIISAGSAEELQLVFWLVVLNQGLYKTVKHSIDSPSFKVLYQPLSKNIRLGTQISIDMIVTPVTTGLAGLMMLLSFPFDPLRFGYLMLAVFAFWMLFTFPTYRNYSRTLVSSLAKHKISFDTVLVGDRTQLAILEQSLSSKRPADIRFAYTCLQRLEAPNLGDLADGLLGHEHPEVRRFALLQLISLGRTESIPKVFSLLKHEANEAARSAGLTALAALGTPKMAFELIPTSSEPDLEIHSDVYIGLLSREDRACHPMVIAALLTAAESPQANERMLTARLIRKAKLDELSELLPALMEDRETEVRREALRSAGAVYTEALWPALASGLAAPGLSEAAAMALVRAGDRVLPRIEGLISDESDRSVAVRCARIAGRIGGTEAIDLLLTKLGIADQRVRLQVLESLRSCRYRPRKGSRQEIHELISSEIQISHWRIGVIHDLGSSDKTRMLVAAIMQELKVGLRRIFLLVGFLHDPRAISTAYNNLAHRSRERRAYALEILDVQLEPTMRDRLLPLLDTFASLSQIELPGSVTRRDHSPEARLAELLAQDSSRVGNWVRTSTIFSAALLEVDDLVDAIEGNAGPSSPPRVRETAQWALRKIAKTRQDGEHDMLAIEKVMILKTVSIFASTPEEALADLVEVLDEVSFEAGERIITEGDLGDSLYIIIDGHVKCHLGERLLIELGEREIFGELAMLDPEPRSADVSAITDTRLFRLERESFFELVADHVDIARGVFKVLCERVRTATARERN